MVAVWNVGKPLSVALYVTGFARTRRNLLQAQKRSGKPLLLALLVMVSD